MEKEEHYTDEDIKNEIKNIFPEYRTRKRTFVDRRNYLICILYYKFNYTEEMIADCFRGTKFVLNRSTINYSKKKALFFAKEEEPSFLRNISILYDKYPFDLPETPAFRFVDREICTVFDLKTLNKIETYARKNKLTKFQAIRRLVKKGINIENDKEYGI